MIATIIICMIAFTWLLLETDYLRVQLLVGPEKITPKFEHCLCHHCSGKNYNRQVTWELPARTVKAWGSTMNFLPGCNRCRAKVLRDVYRFQKSKPKAQLSGAQIYRRLPEKSLAEWHWGDFIPSMTIINGDKELNISGEDYYKRGTIKAFMKA